ncbi:glycoside hydrolase family 2 protein [Mucilaginibacter sp. L196]|uniref:glycoside hydrolase family 2 protein n=1 Tax=Mucilaginibacter sp. L196 TaxID=1641870 RepID=UPI00131CB16D|nr:glycoside hydrolase family 2 TIM barrel-domain containing protein [Mucilaginibacter sp. L196]
MKFVYTALFFFLISHAAFAQRDTINLNDSWKFCIDKKTEGLTGEWYKKDLKNGADVKIPHTWNVDKNTQNYYGWAWYQRKIMIPAQWKNKHIVLQFGAINHTSFIYINGKKVKENIGDGFNKIFINLDDQVRYGAENTITVACNNDFGRNKVPFGDSFDWPNDGGIIRSVNLIVSGKPAASYLNAEPVLNPDHQSGKLKIRIDFDQTVNKNIKLLVSISEENQPTRKVVLQTTTQPVWENGEAIVNYTLPKVNAWHFDFPNLYHIDVTILNGKKAVDKISANFGFRELKFINGQTFLNGEKVKLMGIEWTAGSNPNFGLAETKAEILRNCKLMKDVNAIFSRVHFQQDDVFYDFCDRNGILLQEEIPLWGAETPVNDTIHTIANKQLGEMVRNHYNHPCIFAWGVGNELNGRNEKMKAMIQALINKARQLDPTRMVSYVSNTLKSGFINDPGFVADAGSQGDYLMMNEYAGTWWDIPVGKLSNYLDSIHVSYPDKPFFISEFGLCGPNFKGGDEKRIEDLIYHMAVYETKPYIQGAIYFDLTDYRTHYPGTSDTTKFRRRIHGVYDMYGKPKPSMAVLRELSSPIEVQQMSKKGNKLSLRIYGSIGLPQYIARGYKLYVSDKTDNYSSYKVYDLPEIKPGQRIDFEVDNLFGGKGIVTIVTPLGYITTQKSFLE